MIEDDFSRFVVVGHVLAEGPTSEVVATALREAIRLHDKPERVYPSLCVRSLRLIGIGALVALTGCGRLNFDATTDADAAGGDGATGMPGPRWIHSMGPVTFGTLVAGNLGDVVVAAGFKGTLVADDGSFSGTAAQSSTAMLRYDRNGSLKWSFVLDATAVCNGRSLTMQGDTAILAGVTRGLATSALGPCSTATGPDQEPFEMAIDPAGQPSLIAQWPSTSANAQGWKTASFADGTLAMAGIYGNALTIGSPLPAAGADPNAFITRFTMTGSPLWVQPLSSGVRVYAGPLATDGDQLCTQGAFDGAVSVFGTALPFVGLRDDWVARLDGNGSPVFVRAVGTSGDESADGNGSIIAVPGGGCIASLAAPGDLSIDGHVLPASLGAAVVLRFDTTGNVTSAVRVPDVVHLAVVGGTLYGAFDVSAPITLSDGVYTPEGSDVIVVELDDSGPSHLIGAIHGSGTQTVVDFAAVAPDAVAVAVSSVGSLEFGQSAMISGTQTISVVAVLGL